jgi:imidazolonepropionase-like amidohydrolase
MSRCPAVVLLLALALALPSTAADEVTVVRAGLVVDPQSGTATPHQLILVEGDRITRVGGAEIPAGATVVDLSTMTVLPGLIDCHVHLCEMIPVAGGVGSSFGADLLAKTTADRVLQAVATARELLAAGFTTVREIGNCGHWGEEAVKRAVERGLIEGPTVVTAGKIIAPFGGQMTVTPELPGIMDIDHLVADSRDEMRRAIRMNLHYGADWIKIVVDDQRYLYSTGDIRFIVDEAAAAGVKVAAHCMTEQGARNAIRGGVASIEHGFEMSDETLGEARDAGVFLVGTDLSEPVIAVYGRPEWRQQIVDRLRRAHRIGVPMAFGSDVVVEVPGMGRAQANLATLDTWVAAGIPPADALRALTVDAARLLGMETERGAIRAGMCADLVAVVGNPLESIEPLKRVAFVMKGGEVVARPAGVPAR